MDIREKGLQLLVTRKTRFECLNDKTLVDYWPGNANRFSCLFVILLGTEEVQNLERIPISLAFIQGQKNPHTRLCQSRVCEKSGSQRVQTNTDPREFSSFIDIPLSSRFSESAFAIIITWTSGTFVLYAYVPQWSFSDDQNVPKEVLASLSMIRENGFGQK